MRFKGLLTQDYQLGDFIKIICIAGIAFMLTNVFFNNDAPTYMMVIETIVSLIILLAHQNKRIYNRKEREEDD